MLDNQLLTIAIPTYNRQSNLRKTLEQLRPQLSSECRLSLLDNQSTPPVAETQRELLDTFPKGSFEIFRHRENIGANANIIKCIEDAKTDWVWTLGDDELVRPDAVATILRNINANPDVTYMNFMLPWLAPRLAARGFGWDGFVNTMHQDSTTLISLNVYNRPRLTGHFRWAWLYSTSQLSQLAILYGALGSEGISYFSPDVILDGYAPHEEVKQSWPIVLHGIGRANLIDMPMAYATRKLLITKLNNNFPIHPNVTMRLVIQALEERDSKDALYLYDMFCYRNFYFNRQLSTRCKIIAYRLLVQFPRLGRWVIGKVLRKGNAWYERTRKNESIDRI